MMASDPKSLDFSYQEDFFNVVLKFYEEDAIRLSDEVQFHTSIITYVMNKEL